MKLYYAIFRVIEVIETREYALVMEENIARVWSVGYTGTESIFGGRTKLTEVSGTVVEVVPNHLGRLITPGIPFPTCLWYVPYRINP